MYGKNNIENTMCDVVMECINDVITELVKLFFGEDETKKVFNYKSTRRGGGVLPLNGLTPSHCCACPKPGSGFPMLYVVVVFFMLMS